MPSQLAIVYILTCVVALTVGTWQEMRAQNPGLTITALNATTESTATGLLDSGTVLATGASWATTDAAGDKITYTVIASSATSITLQAKSGVLVAEAGAHNK